MLRLVLQLLLSPLAQMPRPLRKPQAQAAAKVPEGTRQQRCYPYAASLHQPRGTKTKLAGVAQGGKGEGVGLELRAGNEGRKGGRLKRREERREGRGKGRKVEKKGQ